MSNKVNVPNYIKASSPESLREGMFKYAVSSGLDVRFFDIQFDGKDWFVWFYEEIDLVGLLAKANKDKKK